MRLRVGAVVCLFLAFLGAGCRKSLDPTVDNQAPETWITAAPQDTITGRDAFGQPLPPVIGRIPVRFHLYWAGADRDGAVSGFYWAVVETLATPPGDGFPLPSLPGPKPKDYHFTTRTDSTFVFSTSEDVPERQHAFYVYAVDNKGRPDPTPARFIFRAYDRFPPLAIIDEFKAIGRVYRLLPGGGVAPEIGTYFVRDSFEVSRPFPRDTVPSGAELFAKWHGEPTLQGNDVVGYRYKLDEPGFNVVDATVKSAIYNTGVGADVISPGVKVFTLRAVGQSGWRGQTTRYFQLNFAPDDWFAGPDLNSLTPADGWTTAVDGSKYKTVNDWTGFTGVAGTLLSADSANVLPAYRSPRKTFFEIYEDKLWAHQEGDTVHLNSWVILPEGGFDKDSPYKVKVGIDPNTPAGAVTRPDTANGSPIGFRGLALTIKSPEGQEIRPTESTTFPVFDLASVFKLPVISFYAGMTVSGKAYAYVAAEDGDGTIDRTVTREGGPVAIVEDPNGGGPDSHRREARPKVLTFYVNKAPYLLNGDGSFLPKYPNGGTPYTYTSRFITFNILAADDDPIDDLKGPPTRVGGPQEPPSPVLTRTVELIGKDASGRDTSVVVASNVEFAAITAGAYGVPDVIHGPDATLRVTLRDYRLTNGIAPSFGGRDVVTNIPIRIPVGPVPADSPAGASQATQRPGSPAVGRRQ